MRSAGEEEACCGACGVVHRLEYEWDEGVACTSPFGASKLLLTCDEEAKAFLERCRDASWIARLRVAWKHHARTVLKRYMSTTDANGWLDAGKMHLVSTAQAKKMLQRTTGKSKGCLLDVGAGNGAITDQFAQLFQHTVVTETAPAMLRRLKAKKYVVYQPKEGRGQLADVRERAVDAGVPLREGRWFDAILLLHVLDRCDEPWSMLATVRNLLHPMHGKLVLAVVLPFRPFVEDGTTRRIPKESLPLPVNCTWEEGVHLMAERVLVPAGYSILSISRAPYLCEGDLHHPVYSLDDAVFVLRPNTGQIRTCCAPCLQALPAGQ